MTHRSEQQARTQRAGERCGCSEGGQVVGGEVGEEGRGPHRHQGQAGLQPPRRVRGMQVDR